MPNPRIQRSRIPCIHAVGIGPTAAPGPMSTILSRLEVFLWRCLHPGHTHIPPHSESRLLTKLAWDLITLDPNTFVHGPSNYLCAFHPSLRDSSIVVGQLVHACHLSSCIRPTRFFFKGCPTGYFCFLWPLYSLWHSFLAGLNACSIWVSSSRRTVVSV